MNGWHSDRSGERRWHTAGPLLFAGIIYLLVAVTPSFPAVIAMLIVAGGWYAYYPPFWTMPASFLSESAAAASFGLINSVAHVGGFIGPTTVGYLNDWTGGMSAAFVFIGTSYLLAGSVVPAIRIRTPQYSATPASR